MKPSQFALCAACLMAAAAATVPLRANVAGTVAPVAALPKDEAEGVIFERQQLMIALEKDGELLGDIAAGLQPPDKLAQVTRSIANAAKDMKGTFEQHVPGGRSKPEVWINWADYSARMDSFAVKAEEMAVLGEKGNLPAVTAMLGVALPCKQCHDVYRGPKR